MEGILPLIASTCPTRHVYGFIASQPGSDPPLAPWQVVSLWDSTNSNFPHWRGSCRTTLLTFTSSARSQTVPLFCQHAVHETGNKGLQQMYLAFHWSFSMLLCAIISFSLLSHPGCHTLAFSCARSCIIQTEFFGNPFCISFSTLGCICATTDLHG